MPVIEGLVCWSSSLKYWVLKNVNHYFFDDLVSFAIDHLMVLLALFQEASTNLKLYLLEPKGASCPEAVVSSSLALPYHPLRNFDVHSFLHQISIKTLNILKDCWETAACAKFWSSNSKRQDKMPTLQLQSNAPARFIWLRNPLFIFPRKGNLIQ